MNQTPLMTGGHDTYLDIHNTTVFNGDNRVFTNLSMQLSLCQNTCILGPNGAGKTTLLKLLTRELYPVYHPDSHVKLFGNDRAILWELRKKIGFVSQDLQNRYDAHILGRDVILSGLFGAVGLHGHFHITAAHREKTDVMLERFQLQHLQNRRYWHLSTGQQRKFLLARALIHQPQVLVLDEPTNGLDLKAAFELIQDLRTLAQSGTTLLLVTHHIGEIIPEITRLITLKNGTVIADGEKHTILQAAHLSQLYDTPLKITANDGFYQAYPG